MYWMNKLQKFILIILIGVGFSACGAPDYPKKDVVKYRYKNQISADFLLKDTLCNVGTSQDILNYKSAIYSLHTYLSSMQKDIYTDAELSASTNLVEILSTQKNSNGCYDIKTKISVESQKQLSEVSMDVLYAKVKMDKTLVKKYRNVGHGIYGYIVAMKHIPNLSQITNSHYYQYYTAKSSIRTYIGTTNAKHLENINETSISYGLKDTIILHHSYDIDQIKVRYFANTVNKKLDSLNRIYNSNSLTFTKRDNKDISYTEPIIGGTWSVEDFLRTMQSLDKSLEIELDYTLQVPKEFDTQKIYLANSLNSQMFDLYCNGKLISSPSHVYILESEKDQFGNGIVQVKIKSKQFVMFKEYKKYLKELSNRPNMIGEYKRGGLSHMQKALFYVQK